MSSAQRSRMGRPEPARLGDRFELLRRLLSRKVLQVSGIAAALFLIAEILIRGLLLRPTGTLGTRFIPSTPELVTHLFVIALVIGLGFYARWLLDRSLRTREELQEQLSRVQSIVGAFPPLTVCLSRDRRIREWNAASESFFGRSCEKVQGEDFVEHYLPLDYREVFAERLQKVLNGDQASELETILPNQDGTGSLICWEFNALPGPGGTPAGVVVAGRDISKERAASDALREAGRRQRELFEGMTSAVVVYGAVHTGADFVCHDINAAAEKLERLPRRRALRRRASEILPDAKRVGLFSALQSVWRTEKPAYLEVRVRREDGETQWREYYIYKLPSEEVVAICNDITERRQADQDLQRSVWLLDAEGRPASEGKRSATSSYGDLSELNERRVIQDAIGADVLRSIARDYLHLMGTSVAVHEATGDYAMCASDEGWCRFLDEASWELCRTGDNREALSCGKWLCHESCWNGAARQAIATTEPVDVPCAGGLRIYAVPIHAGSEIIGAVSLGYGDPPRDTDTLERLAERYQVDVEELVRLAETHHSRPPFVIELAKRRLSTTARFLGATVHSRRTEVTLNESEQRLQDVSHCAADWLWEVDTQGTYTSCSDRCRKLLGLEPQEIIGKTPFELMAPEDARDAGVQFAKIAQRKEPIRGFENWKIGKDGRLVCMLTKGVPLLDERGHLMGYRGVDTDITARKQGAEDRRRFEEEYRALAEGAREGVIVIQEKTLRFANRALVEISGFSREDLLSHPFAEFIHPDDRKQVMQYLVDAMLGAGDDPCEHRIVTKDGGIRWMETGGVKTTWEGKPATLAFLTDITVRKEIDAALHAREGEFARLSESIPAVVYGMRVDDPDRRFAVSGGSEALTGHSAEELEEDARLYSRILHPNDRDRVMQEIREASAAREAFDLEYRLITRKGQMRWVRDTAVPQVDTDGKVEHLSGLIQDVTRRREVEETLEEREYELRAITDNVSAVVAYIDTDERHHFANDAYCRIFRRTRREIVGNQMRDILGAETYAEVAERIRAALSGKRIDCEISLPREGGEATHLAVSYVPDQRGDGVRGFFLFARDVTSQKTAELARGEIEHELRSAHEQRQRLEQELHEAHRAGRAAREHLQAQLEEAQQAAQETKERLEAELRESKKLGKEAKEQLEAELRQAQQVERAARQRVEVELLEAQKAEQETRRKLEAQQQEAQRVAQETKERLEAELRESRRAAEGARAQLAAELREAQLAAEETKKRLEAELRESRELGEEAKRRLEAELRGAQQAEHETRQRVEAQLREAQRAEQVTKERLESRLREAQKAELETKERLEAELQESRLLGREIKERLELQLQEARKQKERPTERAAAMPVKRSAATEPLTEKQAVAEKQMSGGKQPVSEKKPAAEHPPLKEQMIMETPLPSEETEDKPKSRKKSAPARARASLTGSGEQVLIVADKPTELMQATRMLGKSGYRVMGVGSADKALEYCAREEDSFDLVLYDIAQPGERGAQLVLELLRRRPRIAVLVCSSQSERESAWRQLLDRGVPFIQKPYREPELLSRVKEVLRESAKRRRGDSPKDGQQRAA